MPSSPAVEKLWSELESVRSKILAEADSLTQAQVDWKPGPQDWSVGEILDHLTIAEVSTGKLTSKLFREAEAAGTLGPAPAELAEFRAVPTGPPGPAEAPAVVWPTAGKPVDELLATMKAARVRSRQSVERLATADVSRLTFPHFRFGPLDLGQWWRLQASHDAVHLTQLREVKAAPGFPRGGSA